MTLYLVYLERNISEEEHDCGVVAIFDNEKDAKDYISCYKENKTKEETYYYVDMELNSCKDMVDWWRNRK